ncbi:glycosyltransferase [Planctomycetota bacterium]
MKLLLITYDYEPIISPRAFRWSSIAKHWAEKAHNIDVVCAWRPGLTKKQDYGNIRVYRVGPSLMQVLKNRMNGSYAIPEMPSEKSGNSSFFMRLRPLIKQIYDHTWKKIYWPDFACLWYFPATRKAKQLLKNQNYDALISVSHPFTGHLIGLALKKRYPEMKWLVDIGDPFCFLDRTSPNNRNLFRKLNYSVEQKIFNLADQIVVTTGSTRDEYSKIFSDSQQKNHVIPPMISSTNQNIERSVLSDDIKNKLVFIGTLYKSIRNPDFLLKLFVSLLQKQPEENLELHFWGNTSECGDCFDKYQGLLNNKIFLHGTVGHEKIPQIMNEAKVLVNIGNDTLYQLPSKVVEYAHSGRPILNIVKTFEDSSVDFFKPYPAILNLVDDNNVFSERVEKLNQFIKAPPQIEPVALQQWLALFHVDSIADSYEKLLV